MTPDLLQPVAPGVWVVQAPQSFLGVRVGTRMTVVRLSGGGVLLHSPVPIDAQLKSSIDTVGPVRHIVAPNSYHHLYAGAAARLWPQAVLHGPAPLQRKRSDLAFGAELSESLHPELAADFDAITIRGCLLGETVLYHRATRTLVTADLVENFHACDHAPSRWWFRLGGVFGRAGWHRLFRAVYRDRRAARADVDRILALPFERVIIAHGELLTERAREQVREGLRWL